LDFASTFGVLDVRALDVPRMTRQWYGTAVEPPSDFRVLRHYPGFGQETTKTARSDALRARAIAVSEEQRGRAPNWVVAETIEEFRWGARMLRDLHAAWLCLRDGADPRAVAWQNPLMAANEDPGWLPVTHDGRPLLQPQVRECRGPEAASPAPRGGRDLILRTMTRSTFELALTSAAVVLGLIGYLVRWPPAEVLGLLLACVALGMLLARTLPSDNPRNST
jgi:hypothetical protein